MMIHNSDSLYSSGNLHADYLMPGRRRITELSYNDQQSGHIQMFMLPLLQQLGMQSRWQLWLTPSQRLNRHWLKGAGLPLEKSLHLPAAESFNTIEATIKALRTGNYSVIIAWLPYALREDERRALESAARDGDAFTLILHPENVSYASHGPVTVPIIHSNLFH